MNQRVAEEPEPTRALNDLLEWAGVPEEEANALKREIPDLATLRARPTDTADERLRRAIEAARLSVLPGVDLERARTLAEGGVTVDALATLDEAAGALAAEHGLAADALAAAAIFTGTAPPIASPGPFADGPPAPVRAATLVVADVSTWENLAARAYGAAGDTIGELASTLAKANRAHPGDEVPAGAHLTVPELEGRSPADPEPALTTFAGYIEEDEAAALAQAGFGGPAALVHLDADADSLATGVPRTTLQRLRLQALAERAAMPSEAAHALAMLGGWRTPEALASADPAAVKATLDQAASIGLTTTTYSVAMLNGWLGSIGVALGAGTVLEPVDLPCAAALPDDASLENVFDYRTIPAGIDAQELSNALDARRNYLDQVRALRAASTMSASQAETFRDTVLTELGVTDEDRQRWMTDWGLDLSTESTPGAGVDPKLAMLGRYLVESADIVELLRDLAEGHESYQRGELGLALTAYGRAERWFAQQAKRTGLQGSITPSTMIPFPSRVATWYQTTRPGLDGSAFLDHLQEPFDRFQGYILVPWKDIGRPATADEPFRKFLYYLRNFVLPLCRYDCQLELGNHCEALTQLLTVRHRPAYTNPLGAAEENAIAAGGPGLPAVGEAGLDPAGWGRFGETLLHPVERRLLDLKVSHLMRAWGEYHERRARPRDSMHPDTRRASARYAQAIRVQYVGWSTMENQSFTTIDAFRNELATRWMEPINPLALDDATVAQIGLTRLRSGLNYIGYDEDYVPVWTYRFLLNSARYFAEHARQLERDALQFLASAEAELGNKRLLNQQIGTAESQLEVEARRVAESSATAMAAEVGVRLANLRKMNNIDRVDEFDRQAPTRMALGVIGGAISGSSLGGGNPYAMVVGIAYGSVSSYISGSMELESMRSELIRQQRELNQASGLATADRARALISADIARLSRRHAAAVLAYAQSNLEYATAKTLSADFWFANARRVREFAHDYLDAAIRVSFLLEQVLELDLGRRIDRIKFDYASSADRLAADALLLDLDSLESDRILTREHKDRPIRHVVPLRLRDFQAFEELKQTGTLTFDTTVREFDLAYRGAYMLRLVGVEIHVRALTPPAGIRGVLTKSGLSWLRFDAAERGGQALNVGDDWITETPTSYKIAPIIQEDESMVLSTFDIRRDAAILRASDEGEVRRLFEGSGLAGTWTIDLELSSNQDVDMRTITDVDLVLYLTAQYDAELAVAVELERRKEIARGLYPTVKAKGYAFRDTLPDAFYHLLNGSGRAERLERIVSFDALPREFPFGETNRQTLAISVAFLSDSGPQPMKFALSSVVHSPGYNEPDLSTLNLEPSTLATTDPSAPNVYAFTAFAQAPEDRWFLHLPADDNPALAVDDNAGQPQPFRVDAAGELELDSSGEPIPDAGGRLIFDDEKLADAIADVWWIFRYRYELAGDAGDPVPLWAHFAQGPDAHYVLADGSVGSAQWQEEDANGQWAHSQGAWRRTGPGGGALRESSPGSWDDVRLTVALQPHATAGTEAGLLARYAAGGTGYRVRLQTRSAESVDLVLERLDAGAVTPLGRRDDLSATPGITHSISFECRNGSLSATVDGSVSLVADDTGQPLGAGDVALWASGDGAAFSDLVLTDLRGRP